LAQRVFTALVTALHCTALRLFHIYLKYTLFYIYMQYTLVLAPSTISLVDDWSTS